MRDVTDLVPEHAVPQRAHDRLAELDDVACSTKDISMSSWVNSGWRSLRKSSSR
jgi:hypothetical protein